MIVTTAMMTMESASRQEGEESAYHREEEGGERRSLPLALAKDMMICLGHITSFFALSKNSRNKEREGEREE